MSTPSRNQTFRRRSSFGQAALIVVALNLSAGAGRVVAAETEGTRQPNIIVILADDK